MTEHLGIRSWGVLLSSCNAASQVSACVSSPPYSMHCRELGTYKSPQVLFRELIPSWDLHSPDYTVLQILLNNFKRGYEVSKDEAPGGGVFDISWSFEETLGLTVINRVWEVCLGLPGYSGQLPCIDSLVSFDSRPAWMASLSEPSELQSTLIVKAIRLGNIKEASHRFPQRMTFCPGC